MLHNANSGLNVIFHNAFTNLQNLRVGCHKKPQKSQATTQTRAKQTLKHRLTGSHLSWRSTLYSLQTVWVIGDTYLISPVIASFPGWF